MTMSANKVLTFFRQKNFFSFPLFEEGRKVIPKNG
jgi:hypothetical protein